VADAVLDLTHLSNTLLVAIRDRDRKSLDAVLHADFVQINDAGARTARASFIDAVVSAEVHIKELSFDFLSVDVFGDTGVVCGVQRAAVQLASGEDVTGRTAFTDVFVTSGAGWQLRLATSADLP
jgi:hypothetical protein